MPEKDRDASPHPSTGRQIRHTAAILQEALQPDTVGGGNPSRHDTWIFGYGSLMWRPEFAYVERARATVAGYHRAFCVASTHHRGTETRPGLVLGLDRGNACTGVAYRVAADDAASVVAYLRERELIYGVYRETQVAARLGDGTHREISALAYTVERAHPSYMGALSLARRVDLIRGAKGSSGTNLDYLINTVRHLHDLGIAEPDLDRLAATAAGYALHLDPDALTRPAAAALRANWARRPIDRTPLSLSERRRFMHRQRLGR
jgi:cation transport protein ChaC